MDMVLPSILVKHSFHCRVLKVHSPMFQKKKKKVFCSVLQDVNSKFHLERSSRLDVLSFVYCSYLYLTV